MRDLQSLLAAHRRRATPSNASLIAAGQQESSMASDKKSERTQSGCAEPTAEHIDAINQIFTELELAYHNQFRRAFPDATQLGMAKQLWLQGLCDLTPARLRAGAAGDRAEQGAGAGR